MANVDFSNAILRPNPLSGAYPMQGIPYNASSYLLMDGASNLFADDELVHNIVSNASITVISSVPSKASILYTGIFTAVGTEFYFGKTSNADMGLPWKVSNISFNVGDSYSFIIDIELEVV